MSRERDAHGAGSIEDRGRLRNSSDTGPIPTAANSIQGMGSSFVR